MIDNVVNYSSAKFTKVFFKHFLHQPSKKANMRN